MKRLMSLATFLLTFLAVNISAQSLFERYSARLTEPCTYVCRRATSPPVIDGVLNEPLWQNAVPTDAFVDITGGEAPLPKYETRVRMLWDDDYFYVAAHIEEPDVKARLTLRDTIVWKENDFEVFIDPNGDGVEYFEIEVNAIGTLLDLIMTKPYRSGGTFLSAWNCPGLKHAVRVDGQLNENSVPDRGWTVEMAIPHKALLVNFSDALQQSRMWRVNFSRVEWLRSGGPEENWVWSPTGAVNMHMPERWGYVFLADEGCSLPMPDKTEGDIYRLLWALFYAQEDYRAHEGGFAETVEQLGCTASDLSRLPDGSHVNLQAIPNYFTLSIQTPTAEYLLNADGQYRVRQHGGQ